MMTRTREALHVVAHKNWQYTSDKYSQIPASCFVEFCDGIRFFVPGCHSICSTPANTAAVQLLNANTAA